MTIESIWVNNFLDIIKNIHYVTAFNKTVTFCGGLGRVKARRVIRRAFFKKC